jgi:hypothetical protein
LELSAKLVISTDISKKYATFFIPFIPFVQEYRRCETSVSIIIKIREIQTDFHPERIDSEKLTGIVKAMQVTDSLSDFNCMERNGYKVKDVLSLMLVIIVMANKTVSSSLTCLYSHPLKTI